MSDETSRSGYDEILSSVRKIVSTEMDAAADSAAGKLLLTPALRVDEASEAGATPTQNTSERDYPTLEERIADLEEAVSAEPSDWEPDGSEDQTEHKPEGVVLPLRPDPVDLPADNFEIEDDLETVSDDLPQADNDQGPSKPDAPEPREPVAAPLATFRHRAPGSPNASTSPFSEDDATLLDEAGLRDLVADIVREELQGGLGERITRNVRKLVRAEIQRAFAARDLD